MPMSETPTLDAALFKAQGEFAPVIKKSENPHFKSKYADFASIIETVEPVLRENGLMVHQTLSHINGIPALRTALKHVSGEFVEDLTPLVMLKVDPQAAGSSITYFKRYSLLAILGLAPVGEDDDAESGAGRGRGASGSRQSPANASGGSKDGEGGSGGSQGRTGASFSDMQLKVKENPTYSDMGPAKADFLTSVVGYSVESLKQLSDDDCEAVLAKLRAQ